ncbi:MAG: hypothetical protein CVV41_10490 [Candidatus Riflebacteria bacterium HGW-Riflebacteria-1]|jgi:Icc-related predicted phosphoesterase|nr:MAG: hypothetical protein CVV41_10490 [Candidatus Riflebacteria bacterium HGW-Riflebacteria-1]
MSYNRKALLTGLVLLVLSVICCSAGYAEFDSPFASEGKFQLKQGGAADAANASASANAKKVIYDSDDRPAKVAVIADLHVQDSKQKMLQTAVKAINELPGIYAVAITGDLCRKIGSPAEYSEMIKLVSRFKVPIFAVPGNHDILYRDFFGKNNLKLRTSPAERKAKLERFRKALKLKSLRFSRKVGGHLLVFLPNDDLKGKWLVSLSTGALNFLKETLKKNRDVPTIIFCHAPLEGSYVKERKLGPHNSNAQPAGKIREILRNNPQVFLWVSGHLHIGPASNEYHNPANKVGKVTVIHTPAIGTNSAWMRVLDLTPARAKVRTYNAKTGKYAKKYERVFKHKVKKDKPDKPENSSDASKNDDKNDEKNDGKNEDNDDDKDDNDNEDPSDEATVEEEEADEDVDTDENTSSDEEADTSDNSGDEVEENDESGDTEENNAAAVELIEQLIAKITEFLQGLWSGILKILKV